MQKIPITKSEPDEGGHWGKFGGRYVPETLVAPLEELTNDFMHARDDPGFCAELNQLLRDYCGRPTPLFHARRLTAHAGGAQIYLKREDLLHTGAHKINNAVGQALLAGRMGKRRVIAETGAGQHGVATATVCALFGLRCVIYMGAEDVRRQALNVFRMRLLGVEAGGRGNSLGEHAARFHAGMASGGGQVGVLQGTMSYVLQDANGQIATTHSISAGLDYSAIGPEHAFLHDNRRADYARASDAEALEGFQLCAKLEGIIPALETAHAIMPAIRVARELSQDDSVIINLSGRGDKDVQLVANLPPQ